GGSASGGEPFDAASADRSEVDVATTVTDAAEAAPPVGDAAKPDAASGPDTAVSDSGAQSDARSAPCPPGALLCEDFDKYASAAELAPGWRVTSTAAPPPADAT